MKARKGLEQTRRRAGRVGLAAVLLAGALAGCVLPVPIADGTGGTTGGAGSSSGAGSSGGSTSGGAGGLPPEDPNAATASGAVRAAFCDVFVELRDLPERGDRSVYQAASGEDFAGWVSGDDVTLSTDGRALTDTDRDRTVAATLLGAAASTASIAGFQYNNTIIFLSDGSSYRVEIEDALTVRNWRLTETVTVVQPASGSLFTLINTSRCETVRAQR